MDTKQLLADAKARFAHNSAKAYLKDKYSAKLIVAEQGGLWTASPELIGFLAAFDGKSVTLTEAYNEIVVIDNFGNPVLVERAKLLAHLKNTYRQVMIDWHKEWKELEGKR